MRVLLLGPRPEVVEALYRGEHSIALLYEPVHTRLYRKAASMIDCSCVVDSYRSVESAWSAVHHLGIVGKIDVVITAIEYAIVTAGVLGDRLNVVALDPNVAMLCRDKAMQKRAWNVAGIRTARSLVMPNGVRSTDEAEAALSAAGITPPVVVKPLASGGGESVTRVDSYEELYRTVSADALLGRPLIEEFVEGPEWHFDGVVADGTVTDLMVSRYGAPLLCTKRGEPVTSTALRPAVFAEEYHHGRVLVTRVVQALGIDRGAFHFEAFGEIDNLVAGELACRPGGGLISLMSELTIGVDLWAAHVQTFTGEPIVRTRTNPGRAYGYAHLPSVAGVPNYVTQEYVATLPDVFFAQVTASSGEVMKDMSLTTSTGIGFAAVAADNEEGCQHLLRTVVESVAARHEESRRAAR